MHIWGICLSLSHFLRLKPLQKAELNWALSPSQGCVWCHHRLWGCSHVTCHDWPTEHTNLRSMMSHPFHTGIQIQKWRSCSIKPEEQNSKVTYKVIHNIEKNEWTNLRYIFLYVMFSSAPAIAFRSSFFRIKTLFHFGKKLWGCYGATAPRVGRLGMARSQNSMRKK